MQFVPWDTRQCSQASQVPDLPRRCLIFALESHEDFGLYFFSLAYLPHAIYHVPFTYTFFVQVAYVALTRDFFLHPLWPVILSLVHADHLVSVFVQTVFFHKATYSCSFSKRFVSLVLAFAPPWFYLFLRSPLSYQYIQHTITIHNLHLWHNNNTQQYCTWKLMLHIKCT